MSRKMLWKLLFLYMSTTMSGIVCADANKTQLDALQLFNKAETLMGDHQFGEAIKLYKSAIELYDYDGEIIVKEQVIDRAIQNGRYVSIEKVDESIRAEYRPNERLAYIKEVQTEQYRLANPPELELKWITFRDPTRDNVLDGGETGAFEFELKNTGASRAVDVKLELEVNNKSGLEFDKQIALGEIEPGATAKFSVKVAAEKTISEMSREFHIVAREKTGFDSQALNISLPTRSHQPADVVIHSIDYKDFNNDRLIEPTESVSMMALVANNGKGVSEELYLNVELGENVFLGPEDKPRIQIGKLYPGETRQVSFGFLTNRRFSHNQRIPVKIDLVESGGKQLASRSPDISIYVGNKQVAGLSLSPKNRMLAPIETINQVDIDVNIPQRNFQNKTAVAVVIGNKRYKTPGVPEVKYAHNDARSVRQYLMSTLGYLDKNIIYIEDATAGKLSEVFGSTDNYAGMLYNYIDPGKSDVFVYYTGHGAPDLTNKNAYFVPVDADPNYIANSGYSLKQFYRNIAKLPARHITIVLDTCFSGGSDGGALFKSISPVMIGSNVETPNLKNATVFLSSSGDQVSAWYHEKRHGLFTYFFLKGLSGQADANRNKKVGNVELYNFIKHNVVESVRRITGNLQTPLLLQGQDRVLVDFNKYPAVATVQLEN